MQRLRRMWPVLGAIVFFRLPCSLLEAAEPRAGQVSGLVGQAIVLHPAADTRELVRLWTAIYQHDLLATGEQSRAKFLLGKSAVITLGENVRLSLAEAEAGRTLLDLSRGALRAVILSLAPGQIFEVRTNSAVIAVTGTDFIVETDEASPTQVIMLDGRATVWGRRPGSPSVTVGSGRRTAVEVGNPPASPTPTPPEYLKALLAALDLRAPAPRGAPVASRLLSRMEQKASNLAGPFQVTPQSSPSEPTP